MKTLQDIKEEFAKASGFSSWAEMRYDFDVDPGDQMESRMDKVAIMYARESYLYFSTLNP